MAGFAFLAFLIAAFVGGHVVGRRVRPLRNDVIVIVFVAIMVGALVINALGVPAIVHAISAVVVAFGFTFALSARAPFRRLGSR